MSILRIGRISLKHVAGFRIVCSWEEGFTKIGQGMWDSDMKS